MMEMRLFTPIFILFLCRIFFFFTDRRKKPAISWGMAGFQGEQQVMSDYGDSIQSSAGVLSVLADGRGKQARGAVSAHIAVDSIFSIFKDYQVISNPAYFFKRCFHFANREILKHLEEREGGASLACALVVDGRLYYVLAGDIQIAIYRNKGLIPLSEGHTVAKLMEHSYKRGRVSKQKAIHALKESRAYNYVGQDGFHEIEYFDTPVKLKKHDRVVLMTKGLYDVVPWQEIETAFSSRRMPAARQAEAAVSRFINLKNTERDNGSIVVLAVHDLNLKKEKA